jgi:hypothetical protein
LGGRHGGRVEAIQHGAFAAAPAPPARRDRSEAECLEALREVGTDVHVSQFPALDMRKVAKLVRKGRARWTAYRSEIDGQG